MNIFLLVFWTKVASALEGLKRDDLPRNLTWSGRSQEKSSRNNKDQLIKKCASFTLRTISVK